MIDTDKNEVLHRYPLKLADRAYPMALDEANHRLFVGCRDKPSIVVVDSETGKEVAERRHPGRHRRPVLRRQEEAAVRLLRRRLAGGGPAARRRPLRDAGDDPHRQAGPDLLLRPGRRAST